MAALVTVIVTALLLTFTASSANVTIQSASPQAVQTQPPDGNNGGGLPG